MGQGLPPRPVSSQIYGSELGPCGEAEGEERCVLPFSLLDAVTHDSTEFLRIAALLKLKPQQFDLAAQRFGALRLRAVVAIGSRAATPPANHPRQGHASSAAVQFNAPDRRVVHRDVCGVGLTR